jgi:hypothetical protein
LSGKKKTTDFPEESNFVQLTRKMLKSPAWQDLSPTTKLAYINIKFNHYGDNAKNIKCPFSTLVNTMSPTTWAKATRELQDHGFITVQGSRGLGRKPNIYALSNEWRRWGTENFIKPKSVKHRDPIKGFSNLWETDRDRMMEIRQKRGKTKK